MIHPDKRPGWWFICLLALAITGCAAQATFKEARELIEAGQIEEGLARVQEASKQDPTNQEYRVYYLRQREIAIQRLLAQADSIKLQGQGQWDKAEAAYKRVLGLDPNNARAKSGLGSLGMEQRHSNSMMEAKTLFAKGDTEAAYGKVKSILSENSSNREAQSLLRGIEAKNLRQSNAAQGLSAAMRKPITLEFRDTPLKSVFELISRLIGLNFIFDKDVRPDLRTTIFVRNSSIEDVLRFILVTNQLERKVLNENTLLIYPNTPTKLRDYQELIVRSFYLANADVKQTANMIKMLVKTKDIFIDEKINLLVMRDTRDAVRMAEMLIANQDLAEPEVMLEVEVLEVGSNLLTDLGIRYPDQVSFSISGAAGTPGLITLQEWLNRSSGLYNIRVTNPLLVLNLKSQEGLTNLLANPRIRVKNREKAKIHIGDKVPVITTTSTANVGISESVSYLDIGLKLEVEPNIYLEDEVGIKVGLEVSSIVQEIKNPSGTLVYRLGTRTTNTTLRLKDGETQILAGLISDEERKTADQIPGIGRLPAIGRLFSSHKDTSNKTEIVLLITPRVMRNLARPDIRLEEFPSGTESAIGALPLTLSSTMPSQPAAFGVQKLPVAAAGGVITVNVQAPAQAAAGKEFAVQINVAAEIGLRNAIFDLAFDPSRLKVVKVEEGALVKQGGAESSFKYSVRDKEGRLNLSYANKGDVKGTGVLALATFQVVGNQSGSTIIRVDALSLSDGAGNIIPVPLPAPHSLTIARQ